MSVKSKDISVRGIELDNKDTYVNINDLIIYLMKRKSEINSNEESSAYEKIITKLITIREKAHKK